MNPLSTFFRRPAARRAASSVLAAPCHDRTVSSLPTRALPALLVLGLVGPGLPAQAHGDEDHGDGGAATASLAAPASPRFEAHSELFELVGKHEPGVLALYVTRYESNAPVLGAQVEVEVGQAKASAAFRPERGDYAVTDAAALAVLAQPGTHALVFTLTAGQDLDLLDASLVVPSHARAADHGHEHSAGAGVRIGRDAAFAAGALALAAIGFVLGRRRAVTPLKQGGAR